MVGLASLFVEVKIRRELVAAEIVTVILNDLLIIISW